MLASPDFFGAIGAAATSTLAFIAYVVTLAGWVMIAWKVRRNRALLLRLKDLPEKDRLEALRMEMGAFRMTRGLSPEQVLRARVQTYVLVGFALVCLSILAILAMAWFRETGGLSGVVDLH